jgi:hypothetical protein
MVRFCIAKGCRESDLTVITHRFPKTLEIAENWKRILNVDVSIEELQKRYVICTKHFSAASYRNEKSSSLNTTAMPNLNENLDNPRISMKRSDAKKLTITRNVTQAPTNPPKRPKVMISVQPKANEEDQFEIVEEEYLHETVVEKPEEVCMNEEVVTEVMGEIEIHQANERLEPIETSEKHTQTDFKVQREEKSEVPKESKDDKLISILYPDYKGLSKLKLCEALNEKNQNIKILEEKISKLELAMRELL